MGCLAMGVQDIEQAKTSDVSDYLNVALLFVGARLSDAVSFQQLNRELADPNSSELNCRFVSTRGIAKSCDVYPKPIVADDGRFDADQYRDIENGDRVYVVTSALRHFVQQILPRLEENRIRIRLVTGSSTRGAPSEIGKIDGIDYEHIVPKSHAVETWFTQNYDLPREHGSIKPIPLGLDYHTLQNGLHWWAPRMTAVGQERVLTEILTKAKPFQKRRDRTLSCHQFNMFERHGRDRYVANEALLDARYNDFLPGRTDRRSLWQLMSDYKYVISPHGNGLDCHRTYEAMCLGCVPVVRSSPLDILHRTMPVIILEQWDDISLAHLDQKAAEVLSRDRATLTLDHWQNYLNS